MEIGFSLGSNMGDRLAHLVRARSLLAATPGIDIVASAPVYETEPVGVGEAHRNDVFLNTVVIASCALDLQTLAERIQVIEKELGRRRCEDRNAPRPIDVDVIYVTETETHTSPLELPHPRWAARRFVVEPLAAVRPDLAIGSGNRTVADVLLSLSETPRVVLLKNEW